MFGIIKSEIIKANVHVVLMDNGKPTSQCGQRVDLKCRFYFVGEITIAMIPQNKI